MGKKSNCWVVSLVLQNRLHRSKLFSSTLLDFVQLDLPIFATFATPPINLYHHYHHHLRQGYHLLSTKLKISQLENDRNPFQVKIILDARLLIYAFSFFRLSFLGLCCSHALLYSFIPYPHFLGPQALFLFSFLFPSILPSDFFSSSSRVSFLTLETVIYIMTSTTIVCP